MGYDLIFCNCKMLNRRASFYLYAGPSYAVDTACSSSLLALDQALHALRSGLCNAAIVGGSSLCLRPSTTLQFQKLGMLASDGACKSFDSSGLFFTSLTNQSSIFALRINYSTFLYSLCIVFFRLLLKGCPA